VVIGGGGAFHGGGLLGVGAGEVLGRRRFAGVKGRRARLLFRVVILIRRHVRARHVLHVLAKSAASKCPSTLQIPQPSLLLSILGLPPPQLLLRQPPNLQNPTQTRVLKYQVDGEGQEYRDEHGEGQDVNGVEVVMGVLRDHAVGEARSVGILGDLVGLFGRGRGEVRGGGGLDGGGGWVVDAVHDVVVVIIMRVGILVYYIFDVVFVDDVWFGAGLDRGLERWRRSDDVFLYAGHFGFFMRFFM